MTRKITRAVKTVPTDSQPRLFEYARETSAPPPESETRSPMFNDPDPRAITLGTTPLDTHLEALGMTHVFRIRELLREQDWSPFEARYSFKGRRPYAPAAMVGLILHGLIQGIDSLRAMERMAGTDLACWWLSGGIIVDHSTICRFLILHAEELSGTFFENLTQAILTKTGGQCNDLSGDGTVVQAS